jgi:hypothetical protein
VEIVTRPDGWKVVAIVERLSCDSDQFSIKDSYRMRTVNESVPFALVARFPLNVQRTLVTLRA